MGGSSAKAQSEFSRIVTLDRLGDRKIAERIEATAAERDQVRARLGLLGLDRLVADCEVRRGLGDLVQVGAAWSAEVTQTCVVTLEPLQQSLTGDLQASFRPSRGQSSQAGSAAEDEVVVDALEEDPPEILPSDGIDLGELVVQELAVSLDPYPRRSGAAIPGEFGPSEDQGETGPFAALKALKGKE